MKKVADFKKTLTDNNIKWYSYWNKKKYIDVLKEHGLYPEEEEKKFLKKIPNYDRLKDIAKNPKRVTLTDVKTEEVKEFPSIYKASKYIDKCPQTIENWNGRVWNGKYRIDII